MQTNAREYLTKHGLRPSIQRMAVMEYLLTHRTHPTVEEIYSALSPDMPTLSRTTVYNTLDVLAQSGAILVLDIDRNQRRYDGYTKLHAHFMCDCCGRIEDIEVKEDDIISGAAPKEAQIRDIQLLYKGVCKLCQGAEANKTTK